MAPPRGAPRFRWHAHNRFRLLHNGDRFFPAMLAAIDAARSSILLELYLFESGQVADRFIQALASAAARGIATRVLIDGFGSLALGRADRDRLRRAGVELCVFNPLRFLGDQVANLARDHRKLLVVDDRIAFVGGAGITDFFSPELAPRDYWRETMLAVEGEVVHDWTRLFANAWVRAGNRAFRVPPAPRAARAVGTQPGRVAIAHGPLAQDVKYHAHARIRSAGRRLWLATPYFLPSITLRHDLARAAARGVDVRLVLPGERTDHPALRQMSHHYYEWLLREGIRIFEYQPRFIHAKTMLVDDWVSIGSCNFDRWNLRWNLEANQEVDDAGFASDVAAMLVDDMNQCVEIDLPGWAARPPLLARIEQELEEAGQAIERWLESPGDR